MTYRLTASARMAVIAQLIALVLVFGFAVWMFGIMLNIAWGAPDSPLPTEESARTSGELIAAFFLLIVANITPLLAWQLLGELFVRYIITDESVGINSLGMSAVVPWGNIRGLRPAYQLGLTERAELVLKEPLPWRLGLWLHNARRSLPIYVGVSDRETLLATIRDHVGQPMP